VTRLTSLERLGIDVYDPVGAKFLAFQVFVIPAVAMTFAPMLFCDLDRGASHSLPAAQTRTVSPALRRALVVSICQAVKKDEGDRGGLPQKLSLFRNRKTFLKGQLPTLRSLPAFS